MDLLITHQLTHAEIGDGREYRVLATPEAKQAFRLDLLQNGVLILKMPQATEIGARKEFERHVTAAVMGWAL